MSSCRTSRRIVQWYEDQNETSMRTFRVNVDFYTHDDAACPSWSRAIGTCAISLDQDSNEAGRFLDANPCLANDSLLHLRGLELEISFRNLESQMRAAIVSQRLHIARWHEPSSACCRTWRRKQENRTLRPKQIMQTKNLHPGQKVKRDQITLSVDAHSDLLLVGK